VFYAFDLVHLDGFDLRAAPLVDRKQVLRALLADLDPASPIKFSEHLAGSAVEVYRKACDLELEGIVSKRSDSRYRSGRNEAWIKLTCRHRETFLVAGLAYKGKRFDGVYLGQETAGKLVYAGKVEVGFTDELVEELEAAASGLEVAKPPIAIGEQKPKARWLKPVILADVEYRRKTRHGLLRHGLRADLMQPKRRAARRGRTPASRLTGAIARAHSAVLMSNRCSHRSCITEPS
jgi:bifunctional non-homologous end joining protein LigD